MLILRFTRSINYRWDFIGFKDINQPQVEHGLFPCDNLPAKRSSTKHGLTSGRYNGSMNSECRTLQGESERKKLLPWLYSYGPGI